MNLAVLIITYSRPDGLSFLLDTLMSAEVRDIYIAIDGPRNSRDIVNQKKIDLEISKYLHESKIRIHVLKRVQNLGVAGGVLNAIDWFFSQEKMGLILEDDLRISKDLFRFSALALKKYEDNPEVWMISGTQLFPNPKDTKHIVWSNYPMIWGWAGWSKKWKVMRESLLCKKDIGIRQLTDHRYLFWGVGSNRALSGKVDTWDTPLAFEFWKQGKFCLIPPVNLVSNTGYDEVSTNTNFVSKYMNLEIKTLHSNYQLTDKPNPVFAKKYDLLLEKEVFKIRKRHILIPYYSLILDLFRFPKQNRRKPLNKRIDWLEV
jgi:hypothetical protein